MDIKKVAYIVFEEFRHSGCSDNWRNMEELEAVSIVFMEKKSAIKYIEDLYPNEKIIDDTIEMVDKYGETLVVWIEEFEIR